ncbi:MAG: SusC/RagA family TonB-linked outer membrane protein [Chitinophagaceae bacterium]|nr:SusC/RagA family TonB-linked outer membrane protein [Chitinophagaceae bacterium]
MQRKNILRLFSCALLLFIFQITIAQDRVITGKVTDAKDGSPVSGASVTVKGSRTGTTTGNDGSFSLRVGSSATTLVISSVGYETQEVSIAGVSNVDISFVPTSGPSLNEVVVTGYGSARKRDLTGAVTSVKAKDFNKGVFTSPEQLIQGKVPGLQITNNNGAPNANATIRIRGTSSVRSGNNPLIVIDGVQLTGGSGRPNLGTDFGAMPDANPFAFLSAVDIEAIDVLKDASAAAIYGSRGANGVILITTKKGKAGAPAIDVNYTVGTARMARAIEVLSADEYRNALTKYNLTSGNYGASVDAMKEIMQTGITQNIAVGFTGGSENARQRLSVSYLGEKGIVKESDLKRFTAGYAGSFKFFENKKLGLDISLNTAFIDEEIVPISNNAGFQGSLIGQALQWNPTHPFKKNDGTYWIQPQFGATSINPLWMLEMYDDNVNTNTLWGFIAPSYKLTNFLEYKFTYGLVHSRGKRTAMIGRQLLNLPDIANRGFASVQDGFDGINQLNHLLTFNKDLTQNLNLRAIAGYEYVKFTSKFSGISARDFADIGIPYYNMMPYSTVASRNIFNYEAPTNELQSAFLQANVSLLNKYLLTATVRRDGSSKFGENNKYATFPSFAFAWVASQESFLSNVKFINNLKFRLGWGQTGNQAFPSGASQDRYAVTGPGQVRRVGVGNKDLKWETTTTTNVGVDATIWNNRIAITADYFKRVTKDVLFELDFAQPGPSGPKQWKNLPATITNSGFELAINSNILRKKDFNLDLNLNATWLKNLLENLQGTYNTGALSGQGSSGAYVQKLASGYPLNVYYLRQYKGIDKNTGQAIYEQDGDVSFYGEDPNPNFILGASIDMNYKKWSFVINFNGAFGHYIYNETAMNVVPITNLGTRNVAKSIVNADVKEDLSNPITSSTRFLEKGDFLRCQNVRLGYNLGNLGKFIKNANIGITAQNLFLITNYTGFDPEVNVDKNIGGVPSYGIEYIQFPSSRRYQLSFSFSL